MARVATAYVEIKPDLTGFAQELRAKLEAIQAKKSIQIDPDMTGFDEKLRAQLGRAMNNPTINQDTDRLGGLLGSRLGSAIAGRLGPAGDQGSRDFSRRFRQGVQGRDGNLIMRSVGGLVEGIGRIFRVRLLRNLGRSLGRRSLRGLEGGFARFGALAAKGITVAGEQVFKAMMDLSGDFARFGLTAFAGVAENMATWVLGAFKGLSDSASSFFSSVLPGIGQVASGIGVVALGLLFLQAILGAIAIIVFPLIAGVIGLIGAIAELGAAVIAAVAIAPSLLFAVAGAAGVLFLSWDKLKKAFADSKLGEAFDKLKGTIGDIVTSGLVKAFDRLATNVVPYLAKGLGVMAGSINQAMLDMVAFLAACMRVDQINRILATSAGFFSDISKFLLSALDGLLTFADVGGPALRIIGKSLARAAGLFDAWATAVANNGQMGVFFDKMAIAFDNILSLAIALSGWIGSFMFAALGPASQLLSMLTGIVNSWTLWMDTGKGQQMITTFLESANRIVASFMPVVARVVTIVMELAPLFADFMDTAGPALADLATMLGDIVKNLLPGFQSFAAALGAMWADPEFRKSVAEFSRSIGTLVGALGGEMDKGLIIFLLKLQTGINNVVSILMAFFTDVQHLDLTFSRTRKAMDLINEGFQEQQKAAAKAQESFVGYRTTLESQLRAVLGSKSWEDIKTALEIPYDPDNMTTDEWREKVIGALLGVQDAASPAGKATVNNFIAGMLEQTKTMSVVGGKMVDTLTTEVAERHREQYRLLGAKSMEPVIAGATAAASGMQGAGATANYNLNLGIKNTVHYPYQAGQTAGEAAMNGFISVDPFSAGYRFNQRIADGMTENMAAYQASHDLAQRMRNFQPESPAKEGPLSGKGDILLAGRTFTQRLATGMMQGEDDVLSASQALAHAAYVNPQYALPSTVGAIDPRSGLTHATIWLGNDQFKAYVQARIDEGNEDLGRSMIYGRSGV